MVLTFCEASATSMVNTVFSGPLKEVSLGMHHPLIAAVCAVLNNWDEQDCVDHTEEIVFRTELSMVGRVFQHSFNKDIFCSI